MLLHLIIRVSQVSALTALHSLGIVYRKLNPNNIMINARGHVVLFDFSSAEFMRVSNIPHTQPILGGKSTVEYLAPEVLLGWVHDLSVDCWSFGVLLYVMLFGRVRYNCWLSITGTD